MGNPFSDVSKKICVIGSARTTNQINHLMMPTYSLDIYPDLSEVWLSFNKDKGKIRHFKKYAFYPKMKLFYNF